MECSTLLLDWLIISLQRSVIYYTSIPFTSLSLSVALETNGLIVDLFVDFLRIE